MTTREGDALFEAIKTLIGRDFDPYTDPVTSLTLTLTVGELPTLTIVQPVLDLADDAERQIKELTQRYELHLIPDDEDPTP